MLSTTDFLSEYPEFNSISTSPSQVRSIVGRFLDAADAFISDSAFGRLRDQAIGLYTAHNLLTRYQVNLAGLAQQGSPGVVTSVNASTSGLAVTQQPFSGPCSEQAWRMSLARTNYGLQYLALMDAAVGGFELASPVGPGAVVNGITTNEGFPGPGFP